jgi:DNA replication and repair protein RecF
LEKGRSPYPENLRRAEIRSDGREKRLLLDGVEVDRLSSYLGWLPVVTMLLDDSRLIRGAPSERRAFLDLALSKVSKSYLLGLVEYRRVLAHLNRMLLQNPNEALLKTWEDQLVAAGVTIYQVRSRYLPILFQQAAEIAGRLAAGQKLSASYRSTVNLEGDLTVSFSEALARTRGRATELGMVIVGPHRDDVMVMKDDIELRRFGSEGEQRSASVALKLAEAKLLQDELHEAPLFLLDEIASELDPGRSGELFAILAQRGQMFYAAAKPIPAAGKVFHVEAGKIQEA